MSKILAHKRLLFGLIILVICFLLVAVIVVRSCISAEIENYAANADITSITLRDISLTKVTVDVTVRVENPNPIGATVDRIAYDIYFQRNDKWVHLGRADRTEDIVIGSNNSASLVVSNEIEVLSTIEMLLEAVRQGGTINLKVKGSVWIKVGPVSLKVPFEIIRTLSAWPQEVRDT